MNDRKSYMLFDNFVRCIAVLVLVAAGLKAHELATRPLPETSWLTSRVSRLAIVQFELLFSLVLLSRISRRWKGDLAIVCFSVFACFSLFHAISGHASCGCFGNLDVNPWWTLTLDVFIVGLVFAFHPGLSLIHI